MATNDFIGFASSGSANIASQADYAAAAEQSIGMQPGPASSKLANKAWRQGANMAAAIAAVIAEQGYNVLDDGDIATLKAAIIAGFQTRSRTSFSFSPVTTTITVTLSDQRNQICGNVIQIGAQFTCSAIPSNAWYAIATVDLTSLTNLKTGELLFTQSERNVSASATTLRSRDFQISLNNGILRVLVYLTTNDSSGITFKFTHCLVCA